MLTRMQSMIEALYREKGKAEIVDGEIVRMSPTGFRPGRAAVAIAASLRSHERRHYGPKAEQEMAAKRADYFAAGTRVVWDVDLLGEDVVRVYRAADPLVPTLYRRGQTAEAEAAVPAWRFPVDELFA